MRAIRLTLVFSLLLVALLWALADSRLWGASSPYTVRAALIQLSGLLALACMSLALVLAARPRWPEQPLGGLDKMYRLHKWLGIGALLFSLLAPDHRRPIPGAGRACRGSAGLRPLDATGGVACRCADGGRQRGRRAVAAAGDQRRATEGMAVRLLAERGASQEVLDQLTQAVDEGRALLAPARRDPNTTVDARAWGQINRRFHEILCAAAGNRALLSALEHNNKTPLAGPAALTLPSTPSLLETPFVLRAQADHEDLLRAISRREAVRAENLMREHAYRSRENKRVLLESLCGALPAQPLLADGSA